MDHSLPPDSPAPQDPSALAPREFDILALVLLLKKNRRLIAGTTVVSLLVMILFLIQAKPRFSSTAVMVIPQGNVTSAAMAERLALSTSDLLGGGYELYADILRSRSVQDQIIQDFDLTKVFGTKYLDVTEGTLADLTRVETEREGVLRVTVQSSDPKLAADIANDYLRQLDRINSRLLLTTASQERDFLQRELVKEKDALADAEVALASSQEKTSGLVPEAEANAALSALETTRAQLRAAEVQRTALLASETETNPEVVRLTHQIESLQGQLNQLEHGANNPVNGVPTKDVPAAALDYTRRLRDVKFHESLFELLEKQYAAAQEKEAQQPSIVQVLDPAIPARHKTWPPRLLYLLLSILVGAFLGVLIVLVRGFFQSYFSAAHNAAALRELKSAR